MTMFVLSPSVATTTASVSPMPAPGAGRQSMPWPTRNVPGQWSPRRDNASSFRRRLYVPVFLLELHRDDEPTLPQPMMSAHARRAARLALENALREGDDQHLASAFFRTYSTVGEKKRDWRRHRGAEPRRSGRHPCRRPPTIAPIARARTIRPCTLTRSRASAALRDRVTPPSSRRAPRRAACRAAPDHEEGLDRHVTVLCQPDGRRTISADLAELHRSRSSRTSPRAAPARPRR